MESLIGKRLLYSRDTELHMDIIVLFILFLSSFIDIKIPDVYKKLV